MACENTTHLSLLFCYHKRSERHTSRKKKFRSDPTKTVNVLDAWKAQNINKQYINKLYISKCKGYIFMIKNICY